MNTPKTDTVLKNSYELMLVLPSTAEETKQEYLTKIKDILDKKGIEIAELKELYTRKFYHPIDKKSEGIFFLYNLQAEPSAIAESQKDLRLNQDLLRFQFIKLNK